VLQHKFVTCIRGARRVLSGLPWVLILQSSIVHPRYVVYQRKKFGIVQAGRVLFVIIAGGKPGARHWAKETSLEWRPERLGERASFLFKTH
jgi:hypothetical protein